jgi:hypothetical protein
MVYSEVKNEYGFSDEDIRQYREQFDLSTMEAKKHFMRIYHQKQKAEMVRLIESGTLEDIQKIVRMLIERY